MVSVEDLASFNTKIVDLFNTEKILGPVHLSGSKDRFQEKFLVNFFNTNYTKGDWIVSNHRNHFHWLLSGRNEDELIEQIIDGNSMHVADERFITSAIVGGGAPISVGIALGLKWNKSKSKVLCFLGDAAYACGIVKEAIAYAQGHDLPIIFVEEDNGCCVQANTSDCWGRIKNNKVIKYFYNREFPHAGIGKYKMF